MLYLLKSVGRAQEKGQDGSSGIGAPPPFLIEQRVVGATVLRHIRASVVVGPLADNTKVEEVVERQLKEYKSKETYDY